MAHEIMKKKKSLGGRPWRTENRVYGLQQYQLSMHAALFSGVCSYSTALFGASGDGGGGGGGISTVCTVSSDFFSEFHLPRPYEVFTTADIQGFKDLPWLAWPLFLQFFPFPESQVFQL